MMINSRVSEEEVLNSFKDINLQDKEETPDALKNDEKVEDLLGQPSGKFDYKVFYSKPPLYDIPIDSIMPGGWGDEFDDDELVNEEEKKVENIWKDGKKDRTIGVIDIWYNSDEENTEGTMCGFIIQKSAK